MWINLNNTDEKKFKIQQIEEFNKVMNKILDDLENEEDLDVFFDEDELNEVLLELDQLDELSDEEDDDEKDEEDENN